MAPFGNKTITIYPSVIPEGGNILKAVTTLPIPVSIDIGLLLLLILYLLFSKAFKGKPSEERLEEKERLHRNCFENKH